MHRVFVEYVPELIVRVDGVVVGNHIKAMLKSSRVPGKGPGLPPNIVEVTDRKQEGLDLDGPLGWVEFAYDPETDTFTKINMQEDWPETLDGKGGNP